MQYDALLIIDMQKALVDKRPFQVETVLQNIKQLIEACRARGVSIIYVQHDEGIGSGYERGTSGWELCDEIAPQSGDIIVDKHFNSAFRHTKLQDHLTNLHAKHLLLCGMQTQYCVDATCKVAFEYGYEVTVAKGTVTTLDCAFSRAQALTQYYEDTIWDGRYASVMSMEKVLAQLEQIGTDR